MSFEINYDNSIANIGNWHRIKEVMKRARNKEKLVIGFIGGSITQGANSTNPTLCYAYRVYSWWKEKFPQTEFVYCNAGIGGTTSQFGVARVEEDLLSYEPDFVITEFSVNDFSNEHFLETYEGLVRKIYNSPKNPAMLIVHNVYYHNGANAQLQHSKIGRYYQIPCVSMQSSIYPEILSGRIANREITMDDLHPNDKGHELVASVITHFLEKVYAQMNEPEEMTAPQAPLTVNSYEQSIRYRNNNIEPKMNGFVKDETPQKDITDCFKGGWIANKEGASITFSIMGSGISVQYRKSVTKPAPIARVIVDGDEANAKILDANFDEDWGDKLELDTITEHTDMKEHSVCIEIIKANDCVVPFYLVSIIATT